MPEAHTQVPAPPGANLAIGPTVVTLTIRTDVIARVAAALALPEMLPPMLLLQFPPGCSVPRALAQGAAPSPESVLACDIPIPSFSVRRRYAEVPFLIRRTTFFRLDPVFDAAWSLCDGTREVAGVIDGDRLRLAAGRHARIAGLLALRTLCDLGLIRIESRVRQSWCGWEPRA